VRPIYAHMVRHTTSKFYIVIKLDERKICSGSTTPLSLPEQQFLT